MLDGIGDVPRIILAYVTGFGFISGVCFIYAGFVSKFAGKHYWDCFGFRLHGAI